MDKKRIKKGSIRWKVQALAALLTNGRVSGFFKGNIYRGNLKKFCVPGLNCYSCPGALGTCPIGSLQAVIGSAKHKISFYVIGFLTLIGTVLGRWICGWLCPFGWFQELIHKIPLPKIKVSKKLDFLKYLKYVILAVFVILIPMLFVNELGMGTPAFCKYICPAGILEGAIPLSIMNESIRASLGILFRWKLFILIVTVILCIFIYRPFCKWICPLGAIYSLFNPISMYKLNIDQNKCTKCGVCSSKCKMDVKVYEKPNSLECIRCEECIGNCPTKAISRTIGFKMKGEEKIYVEN